MDILMKSIQLFITCILLAAFVTLSGCGHAPATKDDSDKWGGGIVYGKRHAFTIAAPEGWVLDNRAGIKDGLHAVFYPEGSSWKNSETVMYANGYDKQTAFDTLESFMADDAETFRKNDPDLEIQDAGTRKVGDSVAHIMHFFGRNHEAVAYIDTEGAVIVIVMSSRTREGFMKNYRAFLELLDSYFFLTNDVKYK